MQCQADILFSFPISLLTTFPTQQQDVKIPTPACKPPTLGSMPLHKSSQSGAWRLGTAALPGERILPASLRLWGPCRCISHLSLGHGVWGTAAVSQVWVLHASPVIQGLPQHVCVTATRHSPSAMAYEPLLLMRCQAHAPVHAGALRSQHT